MKQGVTYYKGLFNKTKEKDHFSILPSTTYNKGLDSTLTGLNIRAPSKLIIKIFLFPLLDYYTT